MESFIKQVKVGRPFFGFSRLHEKVHSNGISGDTEGVEQSNLWYNAINGMF